MTKKVKIHSVKIQSLASLEAEMRAVARGERKAPSDAARHSFTAAALLQLLSPENRELLALIRDKKPASIAELAKLTGRAPPNLTRTLTKLEAAGLVALQTTDAKRKMPVTRVKKLVRLEIDPYSATQDRLEIA